MRLNRAKRDESINGKLEEGYMEMQSRSKPQATKYGAYNVPMIYFATESGPQHKANTGAAFGPNSSS